MAASAPGAERAVHGLSACAATRVAQLLDAAGALAAEDDGRLRTVDEVLRQRGGERVGLQHVAHVGHQHVAEAAGVLQVVGDHKPAVAHHAPDELSGAPCAMARRRVGEIAVLDGDALLGEPPRHRGVGGERAPPSDVKSSSWVWVAAVTCRTERTAARP